jgi:hypothetical protein
MVGHLLTDKELELLVELLEADSRRLAVEARRTDARAMRKELRERLRVVDRLIERFRELQAGELKA